MSLGCAVWLECDGCEKVVPDHLGCTSIDEAVHQAELKEWRSYQGDDRAVVDVCPMCAAALDFGVRLWRPSSRWRRWLRGHGASPAAAAVAGLVRRYRQCPWAPAGGQASHG